MGWIFGGIFNIVGFFWWLHLISLRLESAYHYSSCSWCYCWSFMKLDAAWHVWFCVALSVMIDGMLAVSAQCGCYHHFLIFCVVILCPFIWSVCLMLLCNPFGFFFWSASCFIVCDLVLSNLFCIRYDMVWCFVVFVSDITWCVCYGDYGLYLVGGLILLFMYHDLCLYLL